MKRSPQHVTGGYVGSSYPEGNADRTSLGGWKSDLKFGKIVGGGVTMALQASIDPQRFWDPEIVEDDSQDPKSKSLEAPPLRKRRKGDEKKKFVESGDLVSDKGF